MATDFDIEWRGKEVFTLATKVNITAMKKAGFVVARDVKKNFTQVTGDINALFQQQRVSARRTKTGKRHFRSKPGEPPAVDTGVLRASITSETTMSTSGLSVEGKVGPDIDHIRAETPAGTDVEYGLYLELGTANMGARPFLRPALKRTRKKIEKIFKKANS